MKTVLLKLSESPALIKSMEHLLQQEGFSVHRCEGGDELPSAYAETFLILSLDILAGIRFIRNTVTPGQSVILVAET